MWYSDFLPRVLFITKSLRQKTGVEFQFKSKLTEDVREGVHRSDFSLRFYVEVSLNLKNLTEQALKEIRLDKEQKKDVSSPVTTESFDKELNAAAAAEGIALTDQTKIGLFISGHDIKDRYYYRMFEHVVRRLNGYDLVYLPFEVRAGDGERIRLVKEQLANNQRLIGAVITSPWKEIFFEAGDNKIGAVNYIVKDTLASKLTRSATDGFAWVRGIYRGLGYEYDFRGKRIVILGAGGAARELAEVLNGRGASRVTFTDTGADKLKSIKGMIDKLGVDYEPAAVDQESQALKTAVSDAHIIVNATGVGKKERDSSVLTDYTDISPDQIFSDLISNVFTPFLQEAKDKGVARTLTGRSMFIYGMVGFMRGWMRQMPGGRIVPEEDKLYDQIDRSSSPVVMVGTVLTKHDRADNEYEDEKPAKQNIYSHYSTSGFGSVVIGYNAALNGMLNVLMVVGGDIQGMISDVGAERGTGRFRTTPKSRSLSRLESLGLSLQSSFDSSGQTTIPTVNEDIIARTKIIFQAAVAFINASEINKAMINAWNKLTPAREINRRRLFVQKDLSSISERLTFHHVFVKEGLPLSFGSKSWGLVGVGARAVAGAFVAAAAMWTVIPETRGRALE